MTKSLRLLVCLLLLFQQIGYGQTINPPAVSSVAPAASFHPVHLRYLQYDTHANGFRVLIDKGNGKGNPDIDGETSKLLTYFYIGLRFRKAPILRWST
jgi:hypothetical protein